MCKFGNSPFLHLSCCLLRIFAFIESKRFFFSYGFLTISLSQEFIGCWFKQSHTFMKQSKYLFVHLNIFVELCWISPIDILHLPINSPLIYCLNANYFVIIAYAYVKIANGFINFKYVFLFYSLRMQFIFQTRRVNLSNFIVSYVLHTKRLCCFVPLYLIKVKYFRKSNWKNIFRIYYLI